MQDASMLSAPMPIGVAMQLRGGALVVVWSQ